MGVVSVRGHLLLALLFVSQFASLFSVAAPLAPHSDARVFPPPVKAHPVGIQARHDRPHPVGKPQLVGVGKLETATLLVLLGREAARWRLR